MQFGGQRQRFIRHVNKVIYKLRACMLGHFSHVQLFTTLFTVASQVPPSMGFSRQEHWSGLPYSPPGSFLTQGSNPCLLHGKWILYHWTTWEAHISSLVAQRVKRLPAMRETQVRSLGQEDPLEKEMATDYSILAWRIPWMEEPGMLQYTGSQRVGHNWATSLLHIHIVRVCVFSSDSFTL